jgi:hypothetical protein
MRPKDVLREEIKGLIRVKGAYVIVSSSGSTTAPALKARVDAMKEAVAAEADHENLHLEFLDRGRVATWVRSHPSLYYGSALKQKDLLRDGTHLKIGRMHRAESRRNISLTKDYDCMMGQMKGTTDSRLKLVYLSFGPFFLFQVNPRV